MPLLCRGCLHGATYFLEKTNTWLGATPAYFNKRIAYIKDRSSISLLYFYICMHSWDDHDPDQDREHYHPENLLGALPSDHPSPGGNHHLSDFNH